jgi:putative heme-binding domain-containing protein
MKWLVFAGVGLLMLTVRPAGQQVQQPPPEQHAGTYSQADIQAGSVVYSAQCLQCHGPAGDRISGVDLRSGRFRNATTDDDLRRIITNGLPGTSMIGQRMEGAQLTALVAFIRNMRDFDSRPVAAGNATRGQAVFEGAGGCLSCHRVGGKGSLVAPDLSEIGTSRNAAALQQSLLEPTSVMMPINRPIRIVTKDGRTLNGRRLNEDTYTIQLMSDQEQLISVAKADVRDYQVLATSTMPSFKEKLSPQELADVVAYLGTLRPPRVGRQGGAPGPQPGR